MLRSPASDGQRLASPACRGWVRTAATGDPRRRFTHIGFGVSPSALFAFATAGALAFALAVASVMVFKTRNGTIVFENLPEKSVVTVDGDTFTVAWPDGKGKGRAQIMIPPGKHAVEVKVNGVRVSGEEVSVDSGGATPFVARIHATTGPTELPVPPSKAPDSPLKQVRNSVGMTLVLIPSGEFEMGFANGGVTEMPPHVVLISRPFYLGDCEVTQHQYQAIMGTNPSHFAGRPENPVEDVTWIDAVTFCNMLSQRERLAPYYDIADVNNVTIRGGKGYRLPTEAEWEYASRSGNPDNVPFRDDPHLGQFAWMYSNCGRMTHPVGQKKPQLLRTLRHVWKRLGMVLGSMGSLFE